MEPVWIIFAIGIVIAAVIALRHDATSWHRSNGTRRLIEASLHPHGKGWDAPVFISRTDQVASSRPSGSTPAASSP